MTIDWQGVARHGVWGENNEPVDMSGVEREEFTKQINDKLKAVKT